MPKAHVLCIMSDPDAAEVFVRNIHPNPVTVIPTFAQARKVANWNKDTILVVEANMDVDDHYALGACLDFIRTSRRESEMHIFGVSDVEEIRDQLRGDRLCHEVHDSLEVLTALEIYFTT